MSYLTLPSGVPNFSQAVISLWFRVPQASIDAAAAAYAPENGAPLNGIIPLVIMGQQGSSNKIETEVTDAPFFIFDETNASTAAQITVITPVFNAGGSPWAVILYSVCETTYTVDCIPSGQEEPDVSTKKVFSSTGTPQPGNPTCIGVDCSSGSGTLYVNFETATLPTVTDAALELRSIDPVTQTVTGCIDLTGEMREGSDVAYCYTTGGSEGPPPGGFPPDMPPMGNNSTPFAGGTEAALGGDGKGNPAYHYEDISDIKYGATGAIESNVIPVSADRWHHALISVAINDVRTHGIDLGDDPGSIADGTESAATLYIAFDDEDKTGLNLSENWVDGGDAHAVITADASSIVNLPQPVNENGESIGGIPQYSLAGAKVPSSGAELGIPGTGQFVNQIHDVETAEFQMFTNITLDTSNETNRRAFVSAEGKPVPPNQKQSPDTGKDSGSIELLGRRPEILLHGSGRWIRGYNTGTTGVDANGNKIDAGQFVPTAKIRKYKPDPSLHGPQSPPALR